MATETYDVAVVGSGAAGGISAYVLVNLGLKVILLEAGRLLDADRDFMTHRWPWELPFRGPGKPGEFDGLWKINEYTAHLYTNPRKDGYDSLDRFHWTRLRAVGGRTNTWGRGCVRFGPLDFKTRSMQGFGDDWPLSYEDLAPYYEKVERAVGISGNRDETYHNAPTGFYAVPPLKPRCTEVLLRERAKKIGVPVLTSRNAVLTESYDDRPACHYCGECGIGCDIRARFSSLDVLIPKLQRRPNFKLQTHAAVHQVLVDGNGRARGVSVVDSRTRKSYEVRSRAVVLAASTVESGRIMLNSKSRFHPRGIGNSSGVIGHYLMDSIKSNGVAGIVPELQGRARVNEDGAGGAHVFIPRFNYNRKNDYHGGYIIGVGTGFGRGISSSGGLSGWGAALKRQVRQEYGSTISLRAYGQQMADFDNYFEIDPSRTDALGIPQVRFHTAHKDNDLKMRDDMYGWIEQILRACGAEVIPYKRGLEAMGDATHECGSARMGADPKTSALNQYCQSHDVKNLFVTDASCFVSEPGTTGITSTIMSLAWRGCEYLAEGLRRGEV